MGKFLVTILSVGVAVGVFTALWVGVNMVFDQATRDWSKFSALAGGLVGFVFFALLDGNRALQTIGPRDDVRESLFFGADGDQQFVGNLVGILWWAIPGALLFAAFGYALSKASKPMERLAIGLGGGAAIGLILGVMLKSRYLPALKALDLGIYPLVGAAVFGGLALLRGTQVPRGATLGVLIGWIIATFGTPTLGPGTRPEAIMALTVAGLIAGAWIGMSPLPDEAGRTTVDSKSRAWIFMAPAMVFISAALVIPALITFYISFFDKDGEDFVGLDNYTSVFRQGDGWNDANFNLSSAGRLTEGDVLGNPLNGGGIFGISSTPLWLGLILLVVGFALAARQGRRTGRTSEWSPQSGFVAASGAILSVFALFSAFRGTIFNNLWWVFTITIFATGMGLLIATLTDGAKGEKVAKSLIFMPMAISFVGASIIWRFMYRSQNVQKSQTGVLNAMWAWLGSKTAGAAPPSGSTDSFDPDRYSNIGVGVLDHELFNFPGKNLFVALFLALAVAFAYRAVKAWPKYQEAGAVSYGLAALIPLYLAWRTFTEGIGGYELVEGGQTLPRPITFLETGPFNNFWLMVVLLWIETGFAMVILSAAIKAVPAEYIEAAKIDGADDSQIFWRITMPSIAPTIGVVVTTIIVRVAKVYDIVKVMTGGGSDTNVLANEMINQSFSFANWGVGAALAIILFITVLPVMVMNIRRMQKEAAHA